MPTFRKERMGEAIRKVVCEHLARAGSPAGGFLTINRVMVTPDYAWAKVFYSAYCPDKSPEEIDAAMAQQVSEYRHAVAHKLNLRKTPRIQFCFDKNTEYAFLINQKLNGSPE